MAARARDLGAKELHAQVFGPAETYVDWAGKLYDIGKAAGIETVVKIPLVEEAIRTTPAIKALGGRILMTACYDAKQMIVAKALCADFIAPYFGRMMEADLDGEGSLAAMLAMNKHETLRNSGGVAAQRGADGHPCPPRARPFHDCPSGGTRCPQVIAQCPSIRRF